MTATWITEYFNGDGYKSIANREGLIKDINAMLDNRLPDGFFREWIGGSGDCIEIFITRANNDAGYILSIYNQCSFRVKKHRDDFIVDYVPGYAVGVNFPNGVHEKVSERDDAINKFIKIGKEITRNISSRYFLYEGEGRAPPPLIFCCLFKNYISHINPDYALPVMLLI